MSDDWQCKRMAPVGDRGQRYEVRVHGWPEDGWSTIGWTNNPAVAEGMRQNALKAPGCGEAYVHDRRPGTAA